MERIKGRRLRFRGIGGENETYRKHVKADCEELLSRFRQAETVRFEVFSQIWREMKFSEIFYGNAGREKRLFSRLVLDSASSFFLPPFSFQIRVGGLYLLYSLYQCQTASPREQIRLALKDWEEVKTFEKDAADAQHLDVVYILQQLMFHKAFHFTAMPTMLFFNKKRKMERSALCEEFMERPSRPQELIGTGMLEELSNIHELYEKLKAKACVTTETSSSVSLIRTDLVPQLHGAVLDFNLWQQKKNAPDEDKDGGEGTSSQQESSDRADLLASIKSKAYGQATEAAKSRRHRQVELDVTGGVAGPSGSSGHGKTNKPSLKARTTEAIHLSGDKWREVTGTTRVNQLSTLDSDAKEKSKVFKQHRQ